MQADASQEPVRNGGSQWPVSSILLFGTFGGRNAAERRYHRRVGFALAAVVCWAVMVPRLSGVVPKEAVRTIAALSPGLIFLYISWEFRQYLLALDELSKAIHLESIAWTYLTGFGMAVVLGGLAVLNNWSINPVWFLALEPIRAIWLYVVSRRY